MEFKFLTQPFSTSGKSFLLGERINKLLKSKDIFYNKVWLVASFAKMSGIAKLKTALKRASQNGAHINLIIGVNNRVTTVEALEEILGIGCNTKIFRGAPGTCMGAKVYCFEAEGKRAEVFISSGNITEGGLYKNHELVVHVVYDLENGDQPSYNEFKISVSNLLEPNEEIANQLSKELINALADSGEISCEVDAKKEKKRRKVASVQESTVGEDLDMLSIVLPSGESIDVSLDGAEDLSEKFSVQEKEQVEDGEEAAIVPTDQPENAQEIKDDLEIEIQGLEPDKQNNVEKLIMEEFGESDDGKEDKHSKDTEDEGKHSFITQYEVIDIEQMLLARSRADETEERQESKQNQAIRTEDLQLIKKVERNRSRREAILPDDIIETDKKVEQEQNECTRKKFIIASSFKKTNTGIINAFFVQINKLKGKGVTGEVRMPTSSRDFSPEFWGWPGNYKLAQSRGKSSKKCKIWQVSCRIIDVEAPENSSIDQIELYQEEGKTSFNLYSKVLIDLAPEEKDIIRIIRCPEGSETVFQCELIRAGSQEYTIWEQFCSQVIKGTERRFGFA